MLDGAVPGARLALAGAAGRLGRPADPATANRPGLPAPAAGSSAGLQGGGPDVALSGPGGAVVDRPRPCHRLFAAALLVRDGLFVIAGLCIMGIAAPIPAVIVYRLA